MERRGRQKTLNCVRPGSTTPLLVLVLSVPTYVRVYVLQYCTTSTGTVLVQYLVLLVLVVRVLVLVLVLVLY